MFKEYEQISLAQNFVPLGENLTYFPYRGHESGLIVFYSDMCPHCTNFQPKLHQVKQLFKQHDVDIGISVFPVHDEEAGSELLQKYFRVKGVPTILYYRDGAVIEFPSDTGREVENVINFIYQLEVDDERRRKLEEILKKFL